MENTVKNELRNYILDCINDEILTNENRDDWHYHAFNEDYYIIGTHRAKEWLKKHSIIAFEAIDIVNQYEENNFGEFSTNITPEWLVNMLVYIYGEEIIYSYDVDTVEELEGQIVNELLNVEIVEKVGAEIYSTEKDFVFFNVVNDTEISNYIFTNDFDRYKNQYTNFFAVDDINTIMQAENNTPSNLDSLMQSNQITFEAYQLRTKAFKSNINTYRCI